MSRGPCAADGQDMIVMRRNAGQERERYMKISIICVGKIKEKFYREAVAEYAKRLSRYCKLVLRCSNSNE